MKVKSIDKKLYLVLESESKVRIDENIADIFYKYYNNKKTEKLFAPSFEETVIRIFKTLEHSEKHPTPEVFSNTPMSEELKVSIIIVNWNGKKHIHDCLDSIKNQTYKNTEVVFVDNNSTDGSIEIIENQYSWVKRIKCSENYGFSKGNNIGIENATGQLIYLLNSDTKIAENNVELLVRKYIELTKQNIHIGAIVPKMKFFYHPAFINAIGNSVYMNGWGSDNCIGYVDLGQFDKIERVMSACFGAVLIPKEVIEKVGILDEKYYMYYEDSDWSFRARKQGFEIIAEPEAIVYHKFGASTDSRPSAFKLYHIVKNRIRFTLKNTQFSTARHSCKNFLKEDIKNILGHAKQLHARTVLAYIRAYCTIGITIPSLLLERRRQKKLRVITDDKIFALAINPNPSLWKDGELRIDTPTIRKFYHQWQ